MVTLNMISRNQELMLSIQLGREFCPMGSPTAQRRGRSWCLSIPQQEFNGELCTCY